MFYSGVHSIFLTSTSNLQKKKNSTKTPIRVQVPIHIQTTIISITDYSIGNSTFSVTASVFSAWGSPHKTILGSCDSRREIVFFGLSSNFVSQKYGKYSTFNLGEISNSKATANSSTTTNQFSNPFGLYQKHRPRQVTVSRQQKTKHILFAVDKLVNMPQVSSRFKHTVNFQ